MLRITIPAQELFDERTQEFIYIQKNFELCLEHSLVSVSKWEQKWHKSFLSTKNKSTEEILYYIKCMTITQNVPDIVYSGLTANNYKQIERYISDSATATTFSNETNGGQYRIITSEQVYGWMFALQIPMECQKWHLNRLLTLIKVCEIQNNPKKTKMKMNDLMARNTELNAKRCAKYNTKG